MGKIGSAVGSAFGGGIGSFWGRDRAADAARVGHDIGSWLPFSSGGMIPRQPIYVGMNTNAVVGGGPKYTKKKGGKGKKKVIAASRGALIAGPPQIMRRR